MKLKILVSSVDPWSENVGSDTLTSLLAQSDSSNIASINIRAKKSDSHVASRYFHIIEDRVIKSIISPSTVTGESYPPVKDNETSINEEEGKEGDRYGKKYIVNRWLLVLIREILWKIGHWKSKQLDEFVESFSPDVFFFPIESYIHLNRINLYIIKKYHPKRVIGYMWDDNFTYKQYPFNLLYKLHRYWLRKSVRKLISECDSLFAINPKMKKELDAAFEIDSVVLTKPVKTLEEPSTYNPHFPIKILYTGKLVIGRDGTIADIVDAIKIVNKDEQRVILDIYTNTALSKSLLSRIDVPGACVLHGFIPQSEVLQEQHRADVLLFAESLSNRDLSARLSFSTKITDYLSAGKCIWAVGNGELAPIGYLKEEDAAIVSTTKESISTQLQSIIENIEIIPTYARKAHDCGIRNHTQHMIQTRFNNIIRGEN